MCCDLEYLYNTAGVHVVANDLLTSHLLSFRIGIPL